MDKLDSGIALGELICKLSQPSAEQDMKENGNVGKYIAEFMAIYICDDEKQCYRHKYAQISQTLYDNKLFGDGVTILLRNIEFVMDSISEQELKLSKDGYNNFCKALDKLYDHISLENVRYGQIEARIEEVDKIQEQQEKLNVLSTQYEQVQPGIEKIVANAAKAISDINDLNTDLEEQKKTIQSHNIQSISIIGLFASIILAFTGGYTMLTGVFANLGNIEGRQLLPYLVLAFIVGAVLFNLVFTVFRFTSRLCHSEKKQPATDNSARIAFWVVNCVCVGGIVLSLLAYYLHWIL